MLQIFRKSIENFLINVKTLIGPFMPPNLWVAFVFGSPLYLNHFLFVLWPTFPINFIENSWELLFHVQTGKQSNTPTLILKSSRQYYTFLLILSFLFVFQEQFLENKKRGSTSWSGYSFASVYNQENSFHTSFPTARPSQWLWLFH